MKISIKYLVSKVLYTELVWSSVRNYRYAQLKYTLSSNILIEQSLNMWHTDLKNDGWSKNDERRTTSDKSAAKWKWAGDKFVEGIERMKMKLTLTTSSLEKTIDRWLLLLYVIVTWDKLLLYLIQASTSIVLSHNVLILKCKRPWGLWDTVLFEHFCVHLKFHITFEMRLKLIFCLAALCIVTLNGCEESLMLLVAFYFQKTTTEYLMAQTDGTEINSNRVPCKLHWENSAMKG